MINFIIMQSQTSGYSIHFCIGDSMISIQN